MIKRSAGNKQPKQKAQGMVEFALVLPLLLLLMFGIIEAGRLMFIYAQVSTASREGARYGSAAGRPAGGAIYYADCAGIRAAAVRVAVMSGVSTGNIAIHYDHGPGTSIFFNGCPPPADSVHLGDRVVVTVSGSFQPLLGIVNMPVIPITSRTARTIVKDVSIIGTPAGSGGGGGSNNPPVVSITQPINNATFSLGDNITFVGTASDAEDGVLSNLIEWYLGGTLIASGPSFSTSALGVGTHTITAQVTDSGGETGSDSVTVIITNSPPSVIINAPADNSTHVTGTSILFSGTATDPEQGDISALIQWSEGGTPLFTGALFTIQASVLGVGTHTITAQITDSGGLTDTDTVTVIIQLGNTPTNTLVPTDTPTVTPGPSLTPTATATVTPTLTPTDTPTPTNSPTATTPSPCLVVTGARSLLAKQAFWTVINQGTDAYTLMTLIIPWSSTSGGEKMQSVQFGTAVLWSGNSDVSWFGPAKPPADVAWSPSDPDFTLGAGPATSKSLGMFWKDGVITISGTATAVFRNNRTGTDCTITTLIP
ncbi:MAG: Ig-like domain-containing protein [Chloroflexota bacterium]